MKPLDYYHNHDQYPSRPHKPQLPTKHTSEQARKYADELDIFNAKWDEYQERARAWNAHNNELLAEFKIDALKDAGLSNHPNKDAIFQYVHVNHSGNNQDFYDSLMEIADLFK
jgi:hypothetical protein